MDPVRQVPSSEGLLRDFSRGSVDPAAAAARRLSASRAGASGASTRGAALRGSVVRQRGHTRGGFFLRFFRGTFLCLKALYSRRHFSWIAWHDS